MTWLAGTVLLLYLLWAGTLFLVQRRLVFPRHLLNPKSRRAAAPDGVQAVELETEAGPVEAFYLPPEGARVGVDAGRGAPAILYAHGNAELARDWASAFRAFSRRGWGVLLVEYPGYGGSAGAPTLRSVTDTMVRAWEHLAGRPEVDADRIVGLGRSLGGGAVAALSRERPLAALVFQSTFTAVADFCRPLLVPRFLVRDAFDNVTALRGFEGPVLLFHGTSDRIVPYAHGRRLQEASGGELVTWSCGHNDAPPDWGAFVEHVTGFLEARGLGPDREPGRAG